MSRNQLPTIFPWWSLKSPKKRRIIFKHDIDTNKWRKLIFDPPEENKPPEVDLCEIREVVKRGKMTTHSVPVHLSKGTKKEG